MKTKIRVVWICHFSNEEVRKRLPLSKMRLNNFIRSKSGKQKHKYYDSALWITNLIKEFQQFQDVELHIIAPFTGLRYMHCEFELDKIYYHFYQPNLPIIHVSVFNTFLYAKWYVNREIKRIKPDIVNLIGTESPYYSITVLGIKSIPIYVSAQTVYSNPERRKYSNSCLKLNWDVELKIHAKEKYFGCTGRMHRDLILHNNPEAIIFKMFFPVGKYKKVTESQKVYDFVFFAGIDKKKGIEDLIDALFVVKKKYQYVLLNIIGKCSDAYMLYLKEKINVLGLDENVVFSGFFQTQEELHAQVIKSNIAVLPIKMDVIPGSVIEAVFLGLPVVTYKTTGTPYFNKNGETILISDIGDIAKLAENMLKLFESPLLRNKLAMDAKAFAQREFDGTVSAKRLLNNYKAVINHYHKNLPIPEEMLFNTDEFPIY